MIADRWRLCPLEVRVEGLRSRLLGRNWQRCRSSRFRYRDANNRIDMKCARTSVPSTWLVVSHISGPTLIQTINRVRDQRARVEGPEQTEQFAWSQQSTTIGGTIRSLRSALKWEFMSRGLEVSRRATSTFRPRASSSFASRSWSQLLGSRPCHMKEPQVVTFHEVLLRFRWKPGLRRLRKQGSQSRTSLPAAQRWHFANATRSMAQRAFGAIASAETVEGDSDDSAYGHVKDANRDVARDDRTFARSTAKLTPALFAEMTGGSGFAARTTRSQPSPRSRQLSQREPRRSPAYASETADQQELQTKGRACFVQASAPLDRRSGGEKGER